MRLISAHMLEALRAIPTHTAKTGRTTRAIIKKAGIEGRHAGSPIAALHRRQLIEVRRTKSRLLAFRRTTYGDALIHHNRAA